MRASRARPAAVGVVSMAAGSVRGSVVVVGFVLM
jgi:hypothetical protein